MATSKPGVVERAKLALRVFNRGLPVASQRKSAPFLWPSWVNGQPQWHIIDYGAYVQEGFSLNALIYSAVMYKARAITAAPLRAYSGDSEHPDRLPPEHPLSQLCARPNPYQSGAAFNSLCQVYFNIAGDVFIHLDHEGAPVSAGAGAATPPKAMRALRPDRVLIVPKDGDLMGYVYVPEGHTFREGLDDLARTGGVKTGALGFLPQDIIHVKLPNPLDRLEGLGYGLPPCAALSRSADVDNDVTRFLKVFFQRGAAPQVSISFEDTVEEDEMQAIRDRWAEIYGGVDNWSEPAVMAHGAKVTTLTPPFEQMGFDKIDERNESRILGPFGVPPILIGTRIGLMRSTYENFEHARRLFWQDTFIPELALFEAEYQPRLTTGRGDWVAFDTSDVPALQQDMPQLVEAAYKMWQMGVPANRALPAVGIDISDVPGGNTGYLPLSVVPVGSPNPRLLPPAAPPPAGGRGEEEAEGEQRAEGANPELAPGRGKEGAKAHHPFPLLGRARGLAHRPNNSSGRVLTE